MQPYFHNKLLGRNVHFQIKTFSIHFFYLGLDNTNYLLMNLYIMDFFIMDFTLLTINYNTSHTYKFLKT